MADDIPKLTGREPDYAVPAIQALIERKELERQELFEESKTCYAVVLNEQAKWLEKTAKGTVDQFTGNGVKYTIEGNQFLFENAGNLKNVISAQQLLTTGQDGSQNSVNLAILNRVKESPISAEMIEGAETVRVIS